ncbi:MAG: tRNA-(ms[2]io[6]A)-hydroxylase [Endozoicomonadaceae bacterium]|nr:tRNA-(ms[2]io[6]A)-hydroxylase [Endozoicomonadaceae bacterium]
MADVVKKFANYDDILLCKTPIVWIEKALSHIDILLTDHANCEKKAAATAMNLLFRYTHNIQLQHKMSRLAREELRHFEQVLHLMQKRNIDYVPLSASGYAEKLRKPVRTSEPGRLMDTLIAGAFIEARSCERFAALVPYLAPIDEELARYYQRLCKSEARHFHDYFALALTTGLEEEVYERIILFANTEKEAVLAEDQQFRFHSGIPAEYSSLC